MDHNKLRLLAYDFTGPGIAVDPTNPVSTLEKIISSVIGFFSIIAIIWFAIQMILAGYKYISSAGDKGKIEEARKSITNGVMGIAISLIAIFLVSLIANLLGIEDAFNLQTQFKKLII